jgi:hypothetical protein
MLPVFHDEVSYDWETNSHPYAINLTTGTYYSKSDYLIILAATSMKANK